MAGQSEKKLNRLMEKAQELFMKYGYSGVSVDQIAKEAGISKMTIYRHFQSKEDLFVKVMTNIIDLHSGIMMDIADKKCNAIEKMEAVQAYSLQITRKFPAILIRDTLEHPNIMERIANYKIKLTKRVWGGILKEGMEKGEIRTLDIDFICELLMGLSYSFSNTDYFSSEAKIAELTEKLFDFLKYGMFGGVKPIKEGVEDEEEHTDGN